MGRDSSSVGDRLVLVTIDTLGCLLWLVGIGCRRYKQPVDTIGCGCNAIGEIVEEREGGEEDEWDDGVPEDD